MSMVACLSWLEFWLKSEQRFESITDGGRIGIENKAIE
jgi:hypothetical protein